MPILNMIHLKKYEGKKNYTNIELISAYVYDVAGDEYSVVGGNPTDSKSRISIKHNVCGSIWSPMIYSFVNDGKRDRKSVV